MTLSPSAALFVAYLMAVHWVGDFLLQSHRMSIGKSKSWSVLGEHVAVYMLTLFFGMALWYRGALREEFVFFDLCQWALVNALLHFWVDAVTSRWTRRLWDRWILLVPIPAQSDAPAHYYTRLTGTPHYFFVVIGFDQLLHGVMLVLTASWWL